MARTASRPRPAAGAKQRGSRARPASAPPARRYAVVYDIDGPRVRLGILWFVLEVAALLGGVPGLTVLFAPMAGVAALQSARCLKRAGGRPHRVGSGLAAAGLVVAASISAGMLGLALLGLAGTAVVLGSGSAATRKVNAFSAAGDTLRVTVFVGLAAASVVSMARFSGGGAAGLLLIVAAYETGDYLIGSGASNPFEGPVAGASAILVVAFALTAVGLEPFLFPDSFVLAGLAMVLCPLGQLLASAILPRADAPASGLRRLDSLLLTAPAWAVVVGYLVR